jgi:hypothetical protein
MSVLPFLHEPQLLDIFGPFHWICPVLSVCVAFLPLLIYSVSKGATKVAAFLLVWYSLSFYLSQFPAVASPTGYSLEKDLFGFLFFGSYGVTGIALFYGLLFRPDSTVQDLMYRWPASFLCAHQFYRLGGACFWYLYAAKGLHTYYYLQTGILDTFMGVSAIPMALWVGNKPVRESRSLLLAWHAIGLYDLVFSFACAIGEFFGVVEWQHSTAYIAFSPITLVCYFQGKQFHSISK